MAGAGTVALELLQQAPGLAVILAPSAGGLGHLDVRVCGHYYVSMRTTLTPDPDVAQLVEDAVHREPRPLDDAILEAAQRRP